MKWLFFFSLLVLSCSAPTASQSQTEQEEDQDIFAFANNDSGTKASFDFMQKKAYQETYQYKVAKSVFDRLIAAKGDFSKRVPTLVISDASRQIAYASPRKAIIGLEMSAYKACQKMGKDSLNAIAVLLAHELIHVYHEHNWKRHFAANQVDTLDAVKKVKNLDDALKLELQSDHLGGLLGYAAGYSTLDIMPRLLDTLVQFYPRIKYNSSSYPSLEERKQIAQQSMEQLKDKIQVYETAKYLIALERYETAKYYLEFILKDFQSRELYNNLGVVCTQAAIQLLGANNLKYGFPIELDAVSRLKNGGLKGDFDRDPEADELLNQAVNYFKQASLLDEKYAPALLNLACVYTLLSHDEVDHYRRANFYVTEATLIGGEDEWLKTKADAKVLSGIISDRQGKPEDAKKHFEDAIKMGSSLANYNLNQLEELPLQSKSEDTEEGILGFGASETKIRLSDFNIDRGVAKLFQNRLDVENVVAVDKSRKANCGLAIHDDSRSYIHLVSREEYSFFQITDTGTIGSEVSTIKVGDSHEELVKLLGQPNRQVETTTGSILIYYLNEQLFEINDKQEIVKIGVYRSRTPSK